MVNSPLAAVIRSCLWQWQTALCCCCLWCRTVVNVIFSKALSSNTCLLCCFLVGFAFLVISSTLGAETHFTRQLYHVSLNMKTSQFYSHHIQNTHLNFSSPTYLSFSLVRRSQTSDLPLPTFIFFFLSFRTVQAKKTIANGFLSLFSFAFVLFSFRVFFLSSYTRLPRGCRL